MLHFQIINNTNRIWKIFDNMIMKAKLRLRFTNMVQTISVIRMI